MAFNKIWWKIFVHFCVVSVISHSKLTLAQNVNADQAKYLTFGEETSLIVNGEKFFKIDTPDEICSDQPIIISIGTTISVTYFCCCCYCKCYLI